MENRTVTSVSAQFIGVVPYCERIEAHVKCLSNRTLLGWPFQCIGDVRVRRGCTASVWPRRFMCLVHVCYSVLEHSCTSCKLLEKHIHLRVRIRTICHNLACRRPLGSTESVGAMEKRATGGPLGAPLRSGSALHGAYHACRSRSVLVREQMMSTSAFHGTETATTRTPTSTSTEVDGVWGDR